MLPLAQGEEYPSLSQAIGQKRELDLKKGKNNNGV
jgi:hypothetical protein